MTEDILLPENLPQPEFAPDEENASQQVSSEELIAPDTHAHRSTFGWIDLLLVTACAAAVLLGGSVAIQRMVATQDTAGQPVSPVTLGLVSAFLESISIFFGQVVLGAVRRKHLLRMLGFVKPARKWMIISGLIGLAMIPLAGWITLLIQMILNLPVENPQLEFLLPDQFSWPGLIASFLLIGVLIPIVEESYFRGLVYPTLRSRWTVTASLVVSSAYFGLLHGNIALIGMAFILGLVLGWVYERSQSIWPPILIHSINNGMKILIMYLFIVFGILQ
jgi:membrane protease YdiL (CAAX protease family)